MLTETHKQRCERESTRDVVYVLRWRARGTREWHVESVWLDRDEAEAFRAGHKYRWPVSEVYGVPANGVLADLLRRDPCRPAAVVWNPPCPVCGAPCDGGSCECPRCEDCGRTGLPLVDGWCADCLRKRV